MDKSEANGAGVFISRLCAWAPGVGTSAQWDEWALGKLEISRGGKGPEISFTEPMFRRRLSQISRMTIQVIHDILQDTALSNSFAQEIKIIFVSFRGELSKQFQINKSLIEEKTLSPAAFSLSVFNAPAALATMALGLKGGYSALFPGKDCFSCALNAAEASLLCGAEEQLIFVYADEEIQQEYSCFFNEVPYALSFGLLLSKVSNSGSLPLPSADGQSPLDFLKKLILTGGIHVSP